MEDEPPGIVPPEVYVVVFVVVLLERDMAAR